MRRAGDRLLFSWRANIFSRERPRLQAEAPRNLAPHPQEPTHKHLHGTRGSSASFLSVSFLTVRARRLCCEHLLPQIALLVVNMGVGHYFVVVLLFIANGAAGEPLRRQAPVVASGKKADSGKPSLTLVMQKAHLSGKVGKATAPLIMAAPAVWRAPSFYWAVFHNWLYFQPWHEPHQRAVPRA